MTIKKSLLALSTLALASSAAIAQSNVTLYGIVDVAVRVDTNRGPTGASAGQSLKTVAPGGMSQSRLGLRVTEDMGDGYRASLELEHRLRSDDGNQAAGDFWRQAWVGLTTPYGRVTIGRQYNVLFDVTTGTFPSFRYSPYIEAFKPEIGVSLGARQNNMVKYTLAQGAFAAAVQVSAGEGAGEKSTGGFVRYMDKGIGVGLGLLNVKDLAGKQVKATVLGGSYTSGPLYVNLAMAKNEFDVGFNTPLVVAYTTAFVSATQGANTLLSATAFDVRDRDMMMTGFTYQVTPQLNIGAQYYRVTQTHNSPLLAGRKSRMDLFAVVADYALSKRTDAYVEYDRSKFASDSAVVFNNGVSSRAGYMAGLRHRF